MTRVPALLTVLLASSLAACGDDADSPADPSPSVASPADPASTTSGSVAPEPTETYVPEVLSRTAAQRLLDGMKLADLEMLVESHLGGEYSAIRVVEDVSTSAGETLHREYVLNRERSCTGIMSDGDRTAEYVGVDATMVLRVSGGDWQEVAPDALPWCDQSPAGAIDGRGRAQSWSWLLDDASYVRRREQLAGETVAHTRQDVEGGTVDAWFAVDADTEDVVVRRIHAVLPHSERDVVFTYDVDPDEFADLPTTQG